MVANITASVDSHASVVTIRGITCFNIKQKNEHDSFKTTGKIALYSKRESN